MKLTVEKPKNKIEDGQHTGEIVDVVERTEPYNYIDVHIKSSESEIILKASYPANLMINGKLASLMSRFGCDIEEGKEIDVENIMKWIYEIPRDKRAVEQFGLIVNK